jgi:hypothetical protein
MLFGSSTLILLYLVTMAALPIFGLMTFGAIQYALLEGKKRIYKDAKSA